MKTTIMSKTFFLFFLNLKQNDFYFGISQQLYHIPFKHYHYWDPTKKHKVLVSFNLFLNIFKLWT